MTEPTKSTSTLDQCGDMSDADIAGAMDLMAGRYTSQFSVMFRYIAAVFAARAAVQPGRGRFPDPAEKEDRFTQHLLVMVRENSRRMWEQADELTQARNAANDLHLKLSQAEARATRAELRARDAEDKYADLGRNLLYQALMRPQS